MRAGLSLAVLGMVLGMTTAAHASHRDPPAGSFYTCPDQGELPDGAARVQTTQCHTVQRGEWLWRIARTMPSSRLDGPDPDRIRPGMVPVVGYHSV